MTTYTLFGQANPGATTSGAGNNGTNGLHFTVSSACQLDGIWHYSPAGATQLPSSIGLYTITTLGTSGTLVHSETASWSGAAGSGWVFAAFASPPSLSSGTNYMAAQFRNDATNRWFDFYGVTWPVASGILTAPKDKSTSALSQGWYNTGTAMAFPTSQSGTAGSNFGMDVQVSAATSHSATASFSVAPSFTAAAAQQQAASFSVAPSFAASARDTSQRASASLSVAPSFTAAPHAEHVASAAFSAIPSFSAAGTVTSPRTAGFTVVPSLAAAATKAEGAPPGYPDGVLGAKIELLLGPTWTDITEAALPDGRQYGSIRSGQPDGAQQPSPAGMNGTWDNPDGDLSPRNSAGPHFGNLRQNTPARVSFTSPYGAYLRLENDSDDRAYVDDTAALHVTGSLELRLEVLLSDYRACVLAARLDNTQPSWYWLLNSDGTLGFCWFEAGGTFRSVTSDVAPAVSWRAFRVTLDASTGTVTFYASDGIDGTWTQLGSALSGTGGAATGIRAGNAPLVIGWSNSLPGQVRGQVSGFRLYDGIGGTVAADAAFSIQFPGVTSWTGLAGLTWRLAGGAELTAQDYRLHGELASLQPTAQVSGGAARVQAAISGRLRRLQQGAAPAAESAIRRATLAQAGDLFPVLYIPMEDGAGPGGFTASRAFGPAAGSQLMTSLLGKVRPAADSSFEASAPLPTLNGDSLSFAVDGYSGASALAVRFLWKRGQTLPQSGSVRLLELDTTGACAKLRVLVNADGTVNFAGVLADGTAAWTETAELAFPQNGSPAWWSVEATASGSGVQYALVALAPGADSGNTDAHTVTGHGSFGTVTGGVINPDLALEDTVFGHLSVQRAWSSLFDLGKPLNAWRTELAGDRFARVCAENGITCRIIGRPSSFQALGPQPRGSVWTVLRDCAQTEQGLLFEPRDCFGLGIRSRESMGIQTAAVTLDFSASNLPGDIQPVDDDSGFLNDVTGSTPGGTSWREVLDDGSATSVSEPEDGGMGRYAGRVPFDLNVASDGELPAAVRFYLERVSADAPRFRNIVADFGIPGAPAADAARLRPGDLVKLVNVPAVYQDSDIQVLATWAAETFGPGRRIAWDAIPWAPYGGAPAGPAAAAVLDTEGGEVLDTEGGQILGTGA